MSNINLPCIKLAKIDCLNTGSVLLMAKELFLEIRGVISKVQKTETFTATATQTVFNLAQVVDVNRHVFVFVNGLLKTNYTIDATNKTLTFSAGLALNDVVVIKYTY